MTRLSSSGYDGCTTRATLEIAIDFAETCDVDIIPRATANQRGGERERFMPTTRVYGAILPYALVWALQQAMRKGL